MYRSFIEVVSSSYNVKTSALQGTMSDNSGNDDTQRTNRRDEKGQIVIPALDLGHGTHSFSPQRIVMASFTWLFPVSLTDRLAIL